jgi:hypothetical protein
MLPHVKLIPKIESRWCRLVGWFSPTFVTRFWTTVGKKIYYPTYVQNPLDPAFAKTLAHEFVHIDQFGKRPDWWMLFLYLLVPVPMLLSYYRWKFERAAYLKAIQDAYAESGYYGDAYLEAVVEVLWTGYGWPWPKPWMRKWFLKESKQ